ncbi:MAG: histone deacetylase family protein [Bacteriovorax sp.]
MIFYHPDCDLKFSDYGVEIPIEDDRASKVFSYLKATAPQLSYFDIDLIPNITREDLLLAHSPDYVNRLFGSYAELEYEMLTCYELVDSFGKYHRYNPKRAKKDFTRALDIVLKQTGVTYWATKDALKSGFSYFLGGGMHHAMSFGGRGFCLVNDIVIALRLLQKENLIKTAWVIDVDAHKGDGTAEITKRDPSIVTMSIHMKEGWPLDSGSVRDPWFIPCNVDVGVDVGEESKYLDKLKGALVELETRFPRPDVAIVVNGADPYEFDELQSTEKIKLTKEQLLARDKMIYEFLRDRKIPQSYVMAGGYGKRSWEIYAQFLKFVWESSSKGPEVSSR